MPAVILWRRGQTMIVDTSFSEIFCCQVACIKFLQKTEFSYCKAYNYYLLCFFLIFLMYRNQRQSIQLWHVGLFLRRNWRQLIFVQAGSPIKRKRYYSLFSANEFNDFIIEETTLKYPMSKIIQVVLFWHGRQAECVQMHQLAYRCKKIQIHALLEIGPIPAVGSIFYCWLAWNGKLWEVNTERVSK